MASPEKPSKASVLRALLGSDEMQFFIEAHNGISARIGEEAGFPALWASGLAISASLGLRDNNEASWTQVLETAEFMADAATVPILIDGDTGYGNFNNFRRFVRKLGERSIAGVCIEDKVFPKTNSFLRGCEQDLADVGEFCGKLKAGKDAQTDPHFVIVARTEALIAGLGVREALERAEAYRAAGADAIIVHSARPRAEDIIEFLDLWQGRHPVILIPTKYHSVPTDVFARRGVRAMIWANHLLRASVAAMQEVGGRIRQDGRVSAVEETIAPLDEIFRLQGDEELRAAENRYLGASRQASAVILAATRGGGPLAPLTREIPKTLLRVGGVSLLDRLCDNLEAVHVSDITVVAGYKASAISRPGLQKLENPDWETTGEAASLALAADRLVGRCIVAFGDILCRRHLLQSLLDDESEVAVTVDRRIRKYLQEDARARDLVKLVDPMPADYVDGEAVLGASAFSADFGAFDGEWTGLLKFSSRGSLRFRDWLKQRARRPDFPGLALIEILNELAREGWRIRVQLTSGDWTSVESVVDLAEASNL